MKVITRLSKTGIERHCTARCYNSTKHNCTCICKGLMHGKGYGYAKLHASQASFYLQLQNRHGLKYFPGVGLIRDMQGR